jgi:hypothetical protein
MAFTAYALPGDRARFLHTGFSGYLAKPFTRVQLLEAVAELFGDDPAADVGGDGAWQGGAGGDATLPDTPVTASDGTPDDRSAGPRSA